MTHANDQMGKAAHDAAMLASGFDFALLGAASPTTTRELRTANLERALTIWPALCQRMAILEACAPNTSRKAYDQAAKLRDVVERTS